MTTVSIAVMAHPARMAHVDGLLRLLGQATPVAWDTEGPPSSSPARRWRTARKAWERHDPACEWAVVLQDDAVPCADMLDGLSRALDHVPPGSVVSLYYGTGRPKDARYRQAAALADQHGASWIRTRTVNSGVAVCVPTHTIPAMLAWCDARPRWNVDKRLGRYYSQALAWRCLSTWPSLVDHRQSPSLIDHDIAADGARRAYRHHTGSALELDWLGPTVDATRAPPAVIRQPEMQP